MVSILLVKFLKDLFIYLRKVRESKWQGRRGRGTVGQREKEGQTACSAGAGIPGCQNHDLRRRQVLNLLSYPGTSFSV